MTLREFHTSKMDAKIAQQLWEGKRFPAQDGLLFGTGVFYPITITRKPKGKDSVLALGTPSRISEVLGVADVSAMISRPGALACLVPNLNVDAEESHITVVIGEGSMGGDGFVAVVSSKNSRLQWLLFSGESNPFERVEVTRDGRVVATSTLEESWSIPIASPEDTVIRRTGESKAGTKLS